MQRQRGECVACRFDRHRRDRIEFVGERLDVAPRIGIGERQPDPRDRRAIEPVCSKRQPQPVAIGIER
jgi:hypothetical protein